MKKFVICYLLLIFSCIQNSMAQIICDNSIKEIKEKTFNAETEEKRYAAALCLNNFSSENKLTDADIFDVASILKNDNVAIQFIALYLLERLGGKSKIVLPELQNFLKELRNESGFYPPIGYEQIVENIIQKIRDAE